MERQKPLHGKSISLEFSLGSEELYRGKLKISWWQDGADTNEELYRLYFELIRSEIDRVIACPPTSVLGSGASP